MRSSLRTATILFPVAFAAACGNDTVQEAARRKAIEQVTPGTDP